MRFPTKVPGQGNLSWPQRAQFWEDFRGHLTPVGHGQLQDIGTAFRQRYLSSEGGLFKGVRQIDGRVMHAYTSNIQRTLQSAWSFLIGLVPSAAVFFAYRQERVFSDAVRQVVGIPIYIEDASEADDKLFHEWKIGEGHSQWAKQNHKRSSFFRMAADSPEYQTLLERAFRATQRPELDPENEPDTIQRLVSAKDVDTQVLIEEAHNRPTLPNELGIEFTDEELQMFHQIGIEVKRRWFADADGDYEASYGKKAASYLAHKVWRHMHDRATGRSHLRFLQFSCHDTTMAALAAHYGVELPEIKFGAFFAFELHTKRVSAPDGAEQEEHFVKVYYNSRPVDGPPSYANLRSYDLPLGRSKKLVELEDCEPGTIPLAVFEEHSQIPDLEETFEEFMELLGRADSGPTRGTLKSLMEAKASWLTFDQWQARYMESFEALDSSGRGVLTVAELVAFLEEAGYNISERVAEQLFYLVDRHPEDNQFNVEDTFLAMYALVGVRGGVSSKVAGADILRSTDGGEDDVNAPSKDGTTKLMVAANTGNIAEAQELHARGADANAQDEFGWTALRYAVRRGDARMVQELLYMKADVNLASASGRTPLMSAVAHESSNVVQLLIEAGANPEKETKDGTTARHIAARGGKRKDSLIRQLVGA